MPDHLALALFGLHRGSSVDPERLARRARRAEAEGFESLWVGDHIALPADAADNPAREPRLEALVTLAYLAAVTARVGLAVGVIVLPQRQPVLLAKQLTSIDVLSGGRLLVGIGVGYLEAEFRALGVSLQDRGARTDEYLAVMRALWDEPVPALEGRFVTLAGVIERPRPTQRPHPRIVVGGHSAAAHRRAVLAANGWYGWQLGLDETRAALAALAETARRHARPPDLGPLEITITPPGPVDLDTARRYRDLGVHRLALQPPSMDGDAIDALIGATGETLIGRV